MTKDKPRRRLSQARDWVTRHVPPGVRTLLGLLLIAGGLVGFLPVVGFWMIPLGVGVIMIDAVQLCRFIRGLAAHKPETAKDDEADRRNGANGDT